jgi:Fe-S-cluster containining protein
MMDNQQKCNQVRKLSEPDKSLIKLDLVKYGLSYLTQKPARDWTSHEIEKWINAFAKENIAPVVQFPSLERSKLDKLLGKSYCRRCGQCCLPNPNDPLDPGVEVFQQELKLMIRNFHVSHRQLRKHTNVGRKRPNPSQPNEILTTIFLTLPCLFYDYSKKRCKVYEVRPGVCRAYPLRSGEKASLCINVRCDYGRYIYRYLITESEVDPIN